MAYIVDDQEQMRSEGFNVTSVPNGVGERYGDSLGVDWIVIVSYRDGQPLATLGVSERTPGGDIIVVGAGDAGFKARPGGPTRWEARMGQAQTSDASTNGSENYESRNVP